MKSAGRWAAAAGDLGGFPETAARKARILSPLVPPLSSHIVPLAPWVYSRDNNREQIWRRQ